MSGPFGSSQWMYASGGFYPYQIEQSLRFNDNDSAYLSRTPASAGNRKTWTWSGWVKRGNLGTQVLFSKRTAATSRTTFRFASDALDIIDGDTNFRLQTTPVFRDPSSWYHIILVVDTTQATSSDRVKLYVNGDQVTAFSTATYPSLNFDTQINTTNPHYLGTETSPVNDLFDGYMAEVNFIDGTALDPTSFGEFKSGIWVPKAYSGAYGTNGFYLSFADSAAIGDDLSGNGNDWTANNLVSTDVLLDSPTENYCTFNPLRRNVCTLSEGNLRASGPATFTKSIVASMSMPSGSGKWYWEGTATRTGTTDGDWVAGIVSTTWNPGEATGSPSVQPGNTSDSWGVTGNSGNKLNNGSSTAYGATTIGNGDVVMVAYDAINGSFYVGKNGTWFNSGNPATNTNPAFTGITTEVLPAFGLAYDSGSSIVDANFGQAPFAYTPPAGFLALNTANLPDPVIDPAQDDVPADYFNTVLYSGNSSTQSITGVGFQPSWLWLKNRSSSFSHNIYDEVRGTNSILFSDTTASEDTITTDRLQSFDADGFTLGSATAINGSGSSLVAWNWLAGNGTASNTDGSITSTVSVNQKAGFSVVSYTGNGTAGATIGHSLGAAPDVLLVKRRSAANDWQVYHSANTSAPETDYLILNQTLATIDTAATWNDTAPTSSVFTVGNGTGVNNLSDTYIAYCFAEVEGYSKFGSYTGNGSTDGPFVYCGFRPAFVMVKRTDSTGNWFIVDAERDVDNPANLYLTANTSNQEFNLQATDAVDFHDFISNGFKLRNGGSWDNASGGTYIFMAFAEAPFKYSNAR